MSQSTARPDRRDLLLSALALPLLAALPAPWRPAQAAPATFAEAANRIPGFLVIEESPPMPPIPIRALDGGETTVNGFLGRVVLLNLWATWCGPCVAELPSLTRLQKRLGGRDFTVLAVATDRQGERVVRPFVKRLKLNGLPVYLDPTSRIMKSFGTQVLPTTLIIDRFGSVVGGLQGATDWESAAVLQALEVLMAA
ncbi:MAG: TlpA disulfide reductase family protein [Rhodospirillales bacterium]